jgi:hypothetical protein
LKREYFVTEIVAAPDGGPYVLLTFTDPRELKGSSQPAFGPSVGVFTSMEDLMKNLQKTFAGLPKQMIGGWVTVVRMEIREYDESGLKVGDKVYLEITKAEKEGV